MFQPTCFFIRFGKRLEIPIQCFCFWIRMIIKNAKFHKDRFKTVGRDVMGGQTDTRGKIIIRVHCLSGGLKNNSNVIEIITYLCNLRYVALIINTVNTSRALYLQCTVR